MSEWAQTYIELRHNARLHKSVLVVHTLLLYRHRSDPRRPDAAAPPHHDFVILRHREYHIISGGHEAHRRTLRLRNHRENIARLKVTLAQLAWGGGVGDGRGVMVRPSAVSWSSGLSDGDRTVRLRATRWQVGAAQRQGDAVAVQQWRW